MSFNSKVEESVNFFRLFGSVFIYKIDDILAHLFCLLRILDLIETLRRCSLSLQQPIDQVCLWRVLLFLFNYFLHIFCYVLGPFVCLEVLTRSEIDFLEPVPKYASLVYILFVILIES